jgi:hypothetical protein
MLRVFIFFRRVLKNREVEVIVPKPYLNHPLSVIEQKKKDSIHSIENAIGKCSFTDTVIAEKER